MPKGWLKRQLVRGCPRCGSAWTRQSGLLRCSNQRCGYSPESQPRDSKTRFHQKVDPTAGPDDAESTDHR